MKKENSKKIAGILIILAGIIILIANVMDKKTSMILTGICFMFIGALYLIPAKKE